ncbi:MAG: short chain dehydrogenase [Frankiales bacterium]|jgi:thioester reductase-like protein/short-subunit dehydrogenase|nr:short chain dehydrogenase [Frankiales bacterium]
MTTYLVTGGTGFLGRHLLERLLRRPDAKVSVLVRKGSLSRLQAAAQRLEGGDRVRPVVGDLSVEGLGLRAADRKRLQGVAHVVHLAALYDMTADDESNRQVNVEGTRRVVELANALGTGCLHHVSSVAVAGEFPGTFTEDMFDAGQELPSPYHATKYEAERLVRQEATVPWRVYRPAVVVGDSRTGDIDKIDGPYYLMKALAGVGDLPGVAHLPLVGPDLGATNLVPVDYVVDAMDALIHAPDLDGQAFHLVHPRPQPLLDVYNALAEAAGAPKVVLGLPKAVFAPVALGMSLLGRLPGVMAARDLFLARLGIPPEVVPHLTFPTTFSAQQTRRVLHELGVAAPPELSTYAGVLWEHWSQHLDPLKARRRTPGGMLAGRTVAVTGASSGIGREVALAVARKGGIPLLLARRVAELEAVRDEIVAAGGQADVYSVDLTDAESIDACVKQMLNDHDAVDMLVNNAGRSIRRSIKLSYDRFHDFERTMQLNYYGPVRLVLALLPHMTERRFGHVVNISSIGVQTGPPRFSAYVASKAALDAFSRVVSSELVTDGVSFTTIHMPLVRTPMIAPTKIYDAFPTLSPQQAADMVVRALEEQPKHIGTKLGTTGAVAHALAPKLVDALLHTAYHVFPDSIAAGGTDRKPTEAAPEALSRGAAAMVRLLPGVHW